MNVGQNICLTKYDTTTDMSDGRCFLETHCILWAVIASSPSDVSRAGQSVSDNRTLGTYWRDLAATCRRSVACHSSFSWHHRRPVWTPAPLAEIMLRRPGLGENSVNRLITG